MKHEEPTVCPVSDCGFSRTDAGIVIEHLQQHANDVPGWLLEEHTERLQANRKEDA